jgi:hypothetical protein
MVALVHFTEVNVPVHILFGHPSPSVGCGTGLVVTLKATVPFLIALAGIAWVPVAVAGPVCPGTGPWPPGFVQVSFGVPVAERVMRMSPFPRPARFPDAVSVRAEPLLVNVGDPGLKWTLAA